MTYIKTIDPQDAEEPLKTIYARVTGPGGKVDNILLSHSLRPHTLEGHMALYKAVLHHHKNTLPKWFLESIGVMVSLINECDYCVDHHLAGLKRLLRDEERFTKMEQALRAASENIAELTNIDDRRQSAALGYAAKLTQTPASITKSDIDALRSAGLDDGEVLEVNQVTAYFAYANRTVLGLGCCIEGQELGLSPGNNDDPDNWSHE